jgi:translocation and assembly module TamB
LSAGALIHVNDLEGTLNASLDLSGTPENPEAALQIDAAGITYGERSYASVPPMDVAANARLNANGCQLSVALTKLVDKPITLDATLPIAWSLRPFVVLFPGDQPIEGHLNAEAGLGAIQNLLLLDAHHMRGDLAAAFSLAGTATSPVLTGQATIVDGSYENEVTGTVFKDIAVELKADGPRLTLARAQATDGGDGTVSATGHIALVSAEEFPVDVQIELNRAWLARRDDIKARADGTLNLSGPLANPLLQGDLTMDEAEVRAPDRPLSTIPEVEVTEINVPETDEAAPVQPQVRRPRLRQRIKLDVGVKAPGRTFVRAYTLDSEWSGDLRIRGTALEPALSGTFRSLHGRLLFLKQRFELTPSEVRLDGTYPPSPLLDVTLETQTAGLTGRLELHGPAKKPEIVLSSNPPLPQDEILARLLFGKDLHRISPLRALQLAQAARALRGGGGTFDFLGRTRRAFGIDEMEFTQSAEGEDAALNVGKYIGDRVYVEMQKDLSNTGGRVAVEAEITPNVTVQSDVGSNAEGGVWLQWQHDY